MGFHGIRILLVRNLTTQWGWERYTFKKKQEKVLLLQSIVSVAHCRRSKQRAFPHYVMANFPVFIFVLHKIAEIKENPFSW